MSRFSIVVIMGLGALSLVTSGCAGELTDAQKEGRDRDGGSGGSVGSGGSGGSSGSGGGSAGTTGGSPEVCVLALISPLSKACSSLGCHSGSAPAAGLTLTEAVIRAPKDELVDKLNKGNKGVMPGCPAGVGKLIDKAQPEKSLIYTKVTAQSPCGDRMPNGSPLSDAEMACLLNWIKSVASAP